MEKPYIVISIVLGCLLIVLGRVIYRRRNEAALPSLDEWFTVEFDESRVTLSARPPDRSPWVQSFLWSEVTRVCFKSEDLTLSDGIYIFTTQRPESFVVPTEAKGGTEFWSKVIERGLFPAEMAIRAASSPEGAMLCWPAVEGQA